MAEGKKSVVIYTDLIHTVEKLPDDKAGQLFKHFLRYVNDLEPETDDIIINIAFEPIKQQLKRDLKKWDETLAVRSKAGKASAEARRLKKEHNPTHSTHVKSVQHNPTHSTVSVNDNDNVSVNVNDTVIEEKEKVFMFKNSLIDLGIEKQIAEDWLKVRRKKKSVDSETAFKAIKEQIEISGLSANECIKKSVENSWAGFKSEWLNTTQQKGINHPFVMSDEKRNYEQF